MILSWLVVAGLLLWLSVVISVAGAFREFSPETALRFWPIDGFSKSALADRVLAGGLNRQNLTRARSLAFAGLTAEPTSAAAARTLALVSQADEARLRQRMLYARRLSRRDLPTTLWLLEDAVGQNNVARALRQYDIALRTSNAARPILFPILDSALAQQNLRIPIADLLATAQPWVPEFVQFTLARGERSAQLAAALAARPRALRALPLELKQRLIATLIDRHHFELANRLYQRFSGRPFDMREPVRAADFEGVGVWPPVDWLVAASGDFGGSLSEAEGLLHVFAQDGATGTVARQLLLLSPGGYVLTVRGSVRAENASGYTSISIACAERTQPPLGAVRLQAGLPGTVNLRFSLAPASCRYFWLNIEAASAGEGGRFEASLDDVRVSRPPAPDRP